MKYRSIVLTILILTLLLAACRSGQTPDEVVEGGENGPSSTGNNEDPQPPSNETPSEEIIDETGVVIAAQPDSETVTPTATVDVTPLPVPTITATSTPEISDEVIDETNIVAAATQTLPPPPSPTVTPTLSEEIIEETEFVPAATEPPPTTEPAGGGGQDGGQSSSNIDVNSGAFEGAILETQIGTGGGGDFGPTCVTDGGLLDRADPRYASVDDKTSEQLLDMGCTLVDGSPFTIFGLLGPSAERPWPYSMGANLWPDNLTRIVLHDLEPFEAVRLLFYRGGAGSDVATLAGWQDVQADANGFRLLKTELPFRFDDYRLGSPDSMVLLRANGDMWTEFGVYLGNADELILNTEGGGSNTAGGGPDSDGDGLSDEEEIKTYYTDPDNFDTDADFLSDGEEILDYGTDPLHDDMDLDGLLDGDEVFLFFTYPDDADSDFDGLLDGDEVYYFESDPLDPDMDQDGLVDGEEVDVYFTDFLNPDSDEDGRSDGDEVYYGTDPASAWNTDGVGTVGLESGWMFNRDYNTRLGWTFSDPNDPVYLEENHRDQWSIHLTEPESGMAVQFDLWTLEILCDGVICDTIAWVGID